MFLNFLGRLTIGTLPEQLSRIHIQRANPAPWGLEKRQIERPLKISIPQHKAHGGARRIADQADHLGRHRIGCIQDPQFRISHGALPIGTPY